MKTNCGVIRDLLPLYAEKLTSEESDALIKEHLAECKDCSEYLEKLTNPIGDEPIAASSNDNSLKLVRKGIRGRRITAVLFAASLVFTLMLIAFSRIVKPDYVSYEDSGATAVETENGDILVQFSDSITSCKVTKSVNEDNRSIVYIEAWTSLWDEILGKTTPFVLVSSNSDKADIVYYCDLSTEKDNTTVIYGTDPQGNLTVLPRLVLGYYFTLAAAASLVVGIAWVILRKNKKASRVIGYLFAAPLSYVIAHLVISTEFVTFSATSSFIMNCIASLAIYGVLVFGVSLIKQRKQDTFAEQREE